MTPLQDVLAYDAKDRVIGYHTVLDVWDPHAIQINLVPCRLHALLISNYPRVPSARDESDIRWDVYATPEVIRLTPSREMAILPLGTIFELTFNIVRYVIIVRSGSALVRKAVSEGLPWVKKLNYHGLRQGASVGSIFVRILFRTEIQVFRPSGRGLRLRNEALGKLAQAAFRYGIVDSFVPLLDEA